MNGAALVVVLGQTVRIGSCSAPIENPIGA